MKVPKRVLRGSLPSGLGYVAVSEGPDGDIVHLGLRRPPASWITLGDYLAAGRLDGFVRAMGWEGDRFVVSLAPQ